MNNDPQATPRTNAVIRDYNNEGFLRTAGALQDLSRQLERELAQKTAEVEALRTEVREWLCENCRTVLPGAPGAGFSCVICKNCGGTTAPRLTVENAQLKQELGRRQSHDQFAVLDQNSLVATRIPPGFELVEPDESQPFFDIEEIVKEMRSRFELPEERDHIRGLAALIKAQRILINRVRPIKPAPPTPKAEQTK